MKTKYFVMTLLLLALLAACGGAAAPTDSPILPVPQTPEPDEPSISGEPTSEPTQEDWIAVRLGERFTLAVGETAVVEKGMMWVTFNGVLEDSRCPSDAICVWAGRAVVSLSLHHNDGVLLPLELSEWDDNEYSHQAEVEGLLVQVFQVEPSPESGTSITSEEYRVTLVVEVVP